MGCKTITGFGINLKNYRDFGSGGHNFYWDAGLCCMLLLGYGMGLIFYRDGGMVPPGTDPQLKVAFELLTHTKSAIESFNPFG